MLQRLSLHSEACEATNEWHSTEWDTNINFFAIEHTATATELEYGIRIPASTEPML